MIHIVTANDARFKSLVFHEGLNVVLADRAADSTEQQTRNSSGKSSLVRLFHFLLGGNAASDSIFRDEALLGWTFALGLDLNDSPTLVARSGSAPNSIAVLGSELEILGQTAWRARLAGALFGLEPTDEKYSPSGRSLLSYFIRREKDGGLHDPFKNSYKQQAWDSQVNLSYLLGLDWRIPGEFEKVRDQLKAVDALKKAAKDGTLGAAIGSAAELRTALAVARHRSERAREELRSFRVLDEYRDSESEADLLTRRLRELRDEDAVDRDLLSDLAVAVAEEAPPGADDLERLWSQVNVLLPDQVLAAFDDVRRFHESIVANRAAYLRREEDAARERTAEREAERVRLDARRSELMQLLSSGGALDQFVVLQAEVGRLEASVEDLRRRYETAEAIESGKTKGENRKRELLLQLKEDYHDRDAILSEAISVFEDYTTLLYHDRRGSFVVEETLSGPKFDIEILGSGSVGIDSMQVLCFDLTLMTLTQRYGNGPGFLVHDSHIFDGVDERQVAGALALGSRLADELNFQYIVTMNTDTIPTVFPDNFDFAAHVNDVRLTDDTEDGGLFGVRFG
jgi:uncharacterized protein YydD (DUF2326 family)